MRNQNIENPPPPEDGNKGTYKNSFSTMNQKRLRRNRLLLFGVCTVVFSTLGFHNGYAAKEKAKSVTDSHKGKTVESSAEAGKKSKPAKSTSKHIEKSKKDVKKTKKNVEKAKKDAEQAKRNAEQMPHKVRPDQSAWNLALVNQSHPITKGYSPVLAEVENGHAVDSRICQDLKDMLAAARNEGLHPIICSSYRSEETQTELFQEEVYEKLYQGVSQGEAEKQAAEWVAPPGTSEHQLGLAVDLVSQNHQVLDKAQENTPEQAWLMKNCANYGFILRYPTDKSAITGVGYEPWHYRYVGKEAAKDIMTHRICLEEYLVY